MNITLEQTTTNNLMSNSFLDEVARICAPVPACSNLQMACRHLGLIDPDEILKETKDLYAWRRGGAESYVCATELSVRTPKGRTESRRYLCKAVLSFGPGIEQRLDSFIMRYKLLATHGINVPRTYYAGDGVLIQDFIDFSFREYVDGLGECKADIAALCRRVLEIADCLDDLRFSPVSFVPDLRLTMDGRCYVVDVGGDLGGPHQASPASRKARDQTIRFLRGQFPDLETEVTANE
jgi:hypothetical protein